MGAATERRIAYYERKYGLSPRTWDATFTAQGSVCAVCKTANPGKRGWFVDHDHATNKVRGILCGRCNTAAGMLDDDPEHAVRLARYVLNAKRMQGVAGWDTDELREVHATLRSIIKILKRHKVAQQSGVISRP